jgi:regulatory protein
MWHRRAVPPPPEPLPQLDRASQATYERALDLLSFSARSARQLSARLLHKGEPAAQVEVVVARLIANGLLDDTRYAEARARAGIMGGQARSRRRMAQDLAHKGVAREVAEAAIRQVLVESGTDEVAVAVRAAQKKVRSFARLEPAERRQKLYAFLARQGHSAEAVRGALHAVLDVTGTVEDAEIPPEPEGD